MSRRQSLKNSTTDSSSYSSLKMTRDDDGGQSKTSSVAVADQSNNEDLILVANGLHSRSVEELKKELSKLSTRKISKSSSSLKNNNSPSSASIGNPSTRKNHQLQRNPSVKLSKNTSARLVISRMDSKTNVSPVVRTSTANFKNDKKKENSSAEIRTDAEEEQIFTKWLENRNFLMENPFSLEGFQLDSSSVVPYSGQCCCCRKNCAKRFNNKAFIGKPAPNFQAIAVVESGEFKTIKLTDFRGKFVVLFFYPRDFTFVCPTEICTFNDRSDEFQALNAQLLACSTDSQFSHSAWIKQPRKEGGLGPIKIHILSDTTHQIAKDYGVYKEDDGLALRGLFIIDKVGILRQIIINDLPVGRNVDEVIRLLQAIQHVDQSGEVCPIGWRPGKPAIKPGEEKKFFEKMK